MFVDKCAGHCDRICEQFSRYFDGHLDIFMTALVNSLAGRGRGWRTGELPSNLNVIMPFSIHVEDRFANNVEGHLPYISKAIQHTF